MKKMFMPLLAGCIPALLLALGAHAQNSKNASVISNPAVFEKSIALADATARSNAAAERSGISAKAIKSFGSSFREVNNVKWSSIKDGFVAWFQSGNAVNRVYYDRNGNWHFTVSYYGEKQLPKEVRALVKQTYYDYNIVQVEEIRVDQKTIYLVHVQDDHSLKILRVCEGEMETAEDFSR